MAQVMDVMSANSNGEVTSKIFKLEKGDTFSVYPVREYMSDVRKDFSDNKSYLNIFIVFCFWNNYFLPFL